MPGLLAAQPPVAPAWQGSTRGVARCPDDHVSGAREGDAVKALVLAGGMATRLAPLSAHIPKAPVPVEQVTRIYTEAPGGIVENVRRVLGA